MDLCLIVAAAGYSAARWPEILNENEIKTVYTSVRSFPQRNHGDVNIRLEMNIEG